MLLLAGEERGASQHDVQQPFVCEPDYGTGGSLVRTSPAQPRHKLDFEKTGTAQHDGTTPLSGYVLDVVWHCLE